MSRERLSLQLLNSFMLNLPFMLGGALAAPQVLLPGRTGLVFDTQTDGAGEEVVESEGKSGPSADQGSDPLKLGKWLQQVPGTTGISVQKSAVL